MVTAWEQYDKRMKSENDHPCIFSSNQHFLLLAFEDGGIDLEKYDVLIFNLHFSMKNILDGTPDGIVLGMAAIIFCYKLIGS